MDMQTKILYKELTMKKSQFNGWLAQWPEWQKWWTSETEADPPENRYRPEKEKRRPR